MPFAVIAVVAILVVGFFLVRTSVPQGNNISQSSNPTNAPGTSKQP